MIDRSTGRRLRLTAGAAALLIALTACGSPGEPAPPAASPTSASSAPSAVAPSEPPAAAVPAPASDEPPAAAVPAPASDEPLMGASAPVSVTIPAVGLDAPLIRTGIREDGTLEVPPGEEGSPASWYDGSPTPGERGASVLLGQVNSTTDDSGVFYDLPQLQAGDEVTVTREDGSTATFEVYALESFAKDDFPTRAVYAPVPGAELRLITCDKGDDPDSRYPNNFVVFAKLVRTA